MREFKTYHPIVNFTYFAFAVAFSCVVMHPVCLILSFIAGFTYSVMLGGRTALKFNTLYLLPLLFVTAAINPLFNHEGITILSYFPNGNPLTMESVLYGFFAAMMIVSVIIHFSCYNKIMTSDKFIYLFGKIIPSLSLVISMVLRFVPKFKTQLKAVSAGQKCIGQNTSDKSIVARAKSGMKILSVMITWSLENAVETADSMKSRGYGLPKRTAYSNFVFDSRDKKVFSVMLLLGAYVCLGIFSGKIRYSYFPSITYADFSLYAISIFLAYFILLLIPVIIEIREDIKWKSLK